MTPTDAPGGSDPDARETRPLVVITGASSGIGQALAHAYARRGWRLALIARRVPEIERWVERMGLARDRVAVYGADVTSIDSIVGAGHACLAAQGVPDVVIANAGISHGVDTAQREDLDVLAQIHATNNVGMAATFHPFIDPMRRRGSGRLVGIASVAGVRGMPGHGAYCASKAAVIRYCESLRGELRGSGVRVVTISPGYVRTPLTAHNPFWMPFRLEADEFAGRAVRAIEAGASHRIIPWQMAIVAGVLNVIPNAWFDAVMAGRPRKRRRGTTP